MKKIMIVDDNYLSAEGIEKNIDWESLNAEIVHICYNGTSAIEAMKKEAVDLIISDIEMPDLDGISMSRQALNINPMVKIILISAYDKFEYARRALLLGALDYIEKPLDYAYLIQKVKNAFALMEREQKNLQHQRLLWPHEKQRIHHYDVGKAQLHARHQARDGECALNKRQRHGQRKQQAGKRNVPCFFIAASIPWHPVPSFILRSGSARSFPALPWQLPMRQTAPPDGSAGCSAHRSSGAAGRGRCTPRGS